MKKMTMNKQWIEDRSIPEPNTGCWLWTHSLNGRGYPNPAAHRISYTLHHGPIPDGLVIRHKCDQPSCVNPDHLTVGTQAENVADIALRGREGNRGNHLRPLFGEANHSAKLTEADVRAIRADPRSGRVVGPEYGICFTTVYKIRARVKWPHVF